LRRRGMPRAASKKKRRRKNWGDVQHWQYKRKRPRSQIWVISNQVSKCSTEGLNFYGREDPTTERRSMKKNPVVKGESRSVRWYQIKPRMKGVKKNASSPLETG